MWVGGSCLLYVHTVVVNSMVLCSLFVDNLQSNIVKRATKPTIVDRKFWIWKYVFKKSIFLASLGSFLDLM